MTTCGPPACSLPSSDCFATATATALHLPFSTTRGVDRRRNDEDAPTISSCVRAWSMRSSKRDEGAGSWDGCEENADDEARVRWEADGSVAPIAPPAARSPQTTGGRCARPTSHALQSMVGLCGFGPLCNAQPDSLVGWPPRPRAQKWKMLLEAATCERAVAHNKRSPRSAASDQGAAAYVRALPAFPELTKLTM